MKYLRIIGICLILAACSQAARSDPPRSVETTAYRTPVTQSVETEVLSNSEMAELVIDALGPEQVAAFCEALDQAIVLLGPGPGRQLGFESFAESWDDPAAARATFNAYEARC